MHNAPILTIHLHVLKQWTFPNPCLWLLGNYNFINFVGRIFVIRKKKTKGHFYFTLAKIN